MSPSLSAYILKYGYMAIFSLVFLQEIGVPNPVPNELVLLFSGYLTSIGQLHFTPVLLTVIAADAIGSSILYMTFYYYGQRVLQQWPHVIPTSKLASLTARVSHKDRWSIYVGRHMPFLRGYTAVAAGLLKISPTIFLPAVLLSALTWSGGYVTAGKLLGHEHVKVVSKLALGKLVLAGLAALCLTVFFGLRIYHRLKNTRTHTSVRSYTRVERSNNQE
jgi:membrane protein DedA with SNARE-associated domain